MKNVLRTEIHPSNGETFNVVEIRSLKQGDYFRRKLTAKTEFIREHYNRKCKWEGAANFCCSDTEDMNRLIYLKPTTNVFVEAY
jgi:hypothetical protein|tara:strand:- start:213 stop:464 length:252 start_codon:yes stop_codon:yes gene_type:complete